MATVSIYLNFTNKTEEAFNFYKKVFGTEFSGEGIMRFKDIPPAEGMPPLPEKDLNLVMHVSLPILGGHLLMGTDAPELMGFKVVQGNNVYINLQPDTRKETARLFSALAEGGIVEQELQDMFWGDYYGSCQDKFGVHWMFACAEPKS
ncbi:MAG: VOC family protein [Salinivirgaceae bacterium]